MKSALPLLFALAGMAFAAASGAAPFTPQDDGQVLTRLPAGSIRSRANPLRELQASWRRNPADVDAAVALAQAQIALARSESDPRYLGHAQATLRAWWDAPMLPPRIRLLRATIRQSNHEFAPALADLDALLRENPRDAQAWLTLSSVQLVVGQIAEARQSCERLRSLAAPLVHATCAAAADSMNGQAAASLAAIEAAQSRVGAMLPAVRSWSASLAGEIAERIGRTDDAERQYRAAVAIDPEDAYARNALADFLLATDRAAAAREVLPRDAGASDPTLLRIAIAARRVGDPKAAQIEQSLFARLAASSERGESLHLREEARAWLELRGDARKALELAVRNWQVQKEIADARLVLQAAAAANDANAARPVLDWMREHKVEDVASAALTAKLASR